MSQVYKAHQDQVDRAVALKVFRPETILGRRRGKNTTVAERRRAEDRFVQEAQVLGKLSHPNCVTVYDFGVEDDRSYMYIAMEFVAGDSLRTAIRRGLKLKGLVDIVEQVLHALREAHSMNIVHRDLKPENIILGFRYSSDEQVVKVLDFGIAKLLRADTNQRRRGELFGTPAYMSPEQCRGDGDNVGPCSDIYALGCVLYEMICGDLPYPAEDPKEMVRLHQEAPIPEVTPRTGLEVSEPLVSFVTRCLQKAPEDRYDSAHEAYGAYREVLEESDITLRRGLEGGDGADGPGSSRRVVVPDNRLEGQSLDPLGDDGPDGGHNPGPADHDGRSDNFGQPVLETVQGPPGTAGEDEPVESDPPGPSDATDSSESSLPSPGAPAADSGTTRTVDPAPSGTAETIQGQPQTTDTVEEEIDDGGSRQTETDRSQTLAATPLETNKAEASSRDGFLDSLDSTTVAVISIVFTIAGFCILLFYVLYRSVA